MHLDLNSKYIRTASSSEPHNEESPVCVDIDKPPTTCVASSGILSTAFHGSSSAVVQLNTSGHPTRIYYQHADGSIHELAGNGPLSAEYADRVIATNPRFNTPIAAIAWDDFQQIRVYYINMDNEVTEVGYWSDQWWLKPEAIGIAVPNSGLLWATINPEAGVRVGYQSVNAPGTITEALYPMSNRAWMSYAPNADWA